METKGTDKTKKPLGIYVHTPYCLKKCRYCDFKSYAETPDLGYFEQLCAEIRQFAEQYRNKYYVDSIFFGGGTPTIVDASVLAAVLHAITSSYEVSDDCEITTEANPETLSEEKLIALKKAGFNRISIGVQSLNDDVLTELGRVHNADKAREAVELSKKYFENVSADLMFGLPKQTLPVWKETLEEVLSWNLQHISFYSLQLEENTPMFEDYKDGIIEIPSWDSNRNMYHFARGMMKAAGYHHYEVSNMAKTGFECRHNLKYWTMMPYLGFGLGAHSFIDNYRLERTADELIGTPQTIGELKGDFIFTELRLIDGFRLKDYKDMFGISFLQEFKNPLEELFADDMLIQTQDGRLRLSDLGLDNTNNVMEKLLNAEEKQHG